MEYNVVCACKQICNFRKFGRKICKNKKSNYDAVDKGFSQGKFAMALEIKKRLEIGVAARISGFSVRELENG